MRKFNVACKYVLHHCVEYNIEIIFSRKEERCKRNDVSLKRYYVYAYIYTYIYETHTSIIIMDEDERH